MKRNNTAHNELTGKQVAWYQLDSIYVDIQNIGRQVGWLCQLGMDCLMHFALNIPLYLFVFTVCLNFKTSDV